jgi:nucleotide-binding universal stress UspA family protein
MIELRNMLCPTDFSDFSRRALEHAMVLARWYDARLTILYVSPLAPAVAGFPPMVSPITLEPLNRERLLQEMRSFAEPAASAGVKTEFVVREGPAALEIVEQARVGAADLIVMGTHGRGGFERLVLGSVAEKVLREAPCPVLTVSKQAEAATPREPSDLRCIVCPTDFSGPATEALRYAALLAERAKARLDVVYVLDWPDGERPHHPPFDVPEYRRYLEEDAQRQLRAAVPDAVRDWCEVRESVLAGKPWREILGLAAARQADLIVLGTHGHGALDHLLFGSTAHHIVRQATCPVLTVRAAAARPDASTGDMAAAEITSGRPRS